MSRRILIGAVASAALCVIPTAAVASQDSPSGSHSHVAGGSRAPRTYWAQGTDSRDPAYRPHFLEIAGDSSWFIRQAHWKKWTRTSADGHGISYIDNCDPDCASGHFTKRHVQIALAHPKAACGHTFFTAITVTFPSGKKMRFTPYPINGC